MSVLAIPGLAGFAADTNAELLTIEDSLPFAAAMYLAGNMALQSMLAPRFEETRLYDDELHRQFARILSLVKRKGLEMQVRRSVEGFVLRHPECEFYTDSIRPLLYRTLQHAEHLHGKRGFPSLTDLGLLQTSRGVRVAGRGIQYREINAQVNILFIRVQTQLILFVVKSALIRIQRQIVRSSSIPSVPQIKDMVRGEVSEELEKLYVQSSRS